VQKRGQAALEFLTTYGWAFLVILVMIGALAYFGVLNPTRFLPNRCQFTAGMSCEKYVIDATNGEVRFKLKSGLPNHIYISAMEWYDNDAGTWQTCGGGAPGVHNKGATKDYTCTVGNLVADSKQKVEIRMTYNEGTAPDPGYQTYMYGEIFGETI